MIKIKILTVIVFCFIFSTFSTAQQKFFDLNSEKDIAELKVAAEKGDIQAQYELGIVYDIQQDFENSFIWIKKSAENGFAKAQYSLAGLYKNGSAMLPKDSGEYLKWLKKSAEGGYPRAQYDLGTLYFNGTDFLDQNFKEAMKWLEASRLNQFRGENLEEMIRVSKKESEGRSVLSKVQTSKADVDLYTPDADFKTIEKIAQKDINLQFDLGVFYQAKGDEKKSIKWYKKAVSNGNKQAELNLATVYFMQGIISNKNSSFKKAAAHLKNVKDYYSDDIKHGIEEMIKISELKKDERTEYIELLKKHSAAFVGNAFK